MDTLWKAQEKDASIKMDHWAIRYPTNTEDVARVCQGMLLLQSSLECLLTKLSDITAKYLETADKSTLPKILQFSSEDKFTKYEICQRFAEIMGLPLEGMIPNTQGNDPNASVQ
jgi:S-adenosylmethionine synthetase